MLLHSDLLTVQADLERICNCWCLFPSRETFFSILLPTHFVEHPELVIPIKAIGPPANQTAEGDLQTYEH